MRSAFHHEFGEPADVLVVGDGPVPQPAPGEVRIRMLLAPIHNHDLWTIRGQYGYKPALPAIGGSEGLGLIDAIGEGVEGLAVGQRVATASGRGTWAEAFVAPAKMVIPMPDAIPDELAAQLIAMPLSARCCWSSCRSNGGSGSCRTPPTVRSARPGDVGRRARIPVLSLVRRDAGAAK